MERNAAKVQFGHLLGKMKAAVAAPDGYGHRTAAAAAAVAPLVTTPTAARMEEHEDKDEEQEDDDADDDDLAYEWEEVTRKHRALAGRLEQLTGGATPGSSAKGHSSRQALPMQGDI